MPEDKKVEDEVAAETEPQLKQYVCNLYKSLQLGKHVKFVDGFFETYDPILQNQIESSSGFGVNIHFRDTLEEMRKVGIERDTKKNAERARLRKEILDEIAANEDAEVQSATKTVEAAGVEMDKKRTLGRLLAADKVLSKEKK